MLRVNQFDRPRIRPCGETALSIELGQGIDPEVNDRVHALFKAFRALKLPGVLGLTPTYRSLLIRYDPWEHSFEHLSLLVDRCLEGAVPAALDETQPVVIPVCYGGSFGPDLEPVAAIRELTLEQAVAIHYAPIYQVCMIGFTPGFPYLGGLDERLWTPRLDTPRRSVPAGSVGIADRQTGIYPMESPGGWRLIGRTPLRLFDASRTEPFLLHPGDRVRFEPISREAFESAQNP